MNIDVESKGSFALVKLAGEVDLSNSKQVKQVLLDKISEKQNLAVDFSALSYIDSSGMASMVEALNAAKQASTQFHIVAANGAPLQVLKLTRLDTVFSMHDSFDAIPAHD